MVSSHLVAAATLTLPLSLTLNGCGFVGPTTTLEPTSDPGTTLEPTSSTSPGKTTTAPPLGECAPVMPNIECSGYSMQKLEGINSTGDCCDHCDNHAECGAYTHEPATGTCYLKRWCEYLVAKTGQHSSMPSKLPATPPPGCVEPELGIGFNCVGEGTEEISVVPGNSQHDCCDLCSKTEGCLIYSFSKSQKTCSLKKNCPVKPPDTDYITGWVVNPEQKTAARYQVGRGYYELDGYQCGGGDPATVMFYPKGDGPFGVVVYGHGAWGYVDGSDDWLETVASLGLIVIAPFQGKDPTGSPCKELFADDLLLALQGSKDGGADLHPALATANWERTGIFGHSKGAKYASLAASKGKVSHGVSAVVSSCDAPSEYYEVTVPSMFTTGTLDKFNADGQILEYWEGTTANPKVYVNLKDAYHMEVQEGMRLNLLTGQFLSCHVNNQNEDCVVIYGNGAGTICTENAYAEGECCVQASADRVVNDFCTTTTTTLEPTTTTTETTTDAPETTTTTVEPTPEPTTTEPTTPEPTPEPTTPETTTTVAPTVDPTPETSTTTDPVPAPAPAELNNVVV